MAIEDIFHMPICTKCGKEKAWDPSTGTGEFQRSIRRKEGHTTRCKECLRLIQRDWYKSHRPEWNSYVKSYRAAHKGLTKSIEQSIVEED